MFEEEKIRQQVGKEDSDMAPVEGLGNSTMGENTVLKPGVPVRVQWPRAVLRLRFMGGPLNWKNPKWISGWNWGNRVRALW